MLIDSRSVFLTLLCYDIPVYQAVAVCVLTSVTTEYPRTRAVCTAAGVAWANPPWHSVVFVAVHLFHTAHSSKPIAALGAAALTTIAVLNGNWLAAGLAIAALVITLKHAALGTACAAAAWTVGVASPADYSLYYSVAAAPLFLTRLKPVALVG
jgi:hypothetical protein